MGGTIAAPAEQVAAAVAGWFVASPGDCNDASHSDNDMFQICHVACYLTNNMPFCLPGVGASVLRCGTPLLLANSTGLNPLYCCIVLLVTWAHS
jgi:hypothetical protein